MTFSDNKVYSYAINKMPAKKSIRLEWKEERVGDVATAEIGRQLCVAYTPCGTP